MSLTRIQRVMDEIKQVFDYPQELDANIRDRLNLYWRDHKSTMKSLGFNKNNTMEQNLAQRPEGVVESQWVPLVTMWHIQENEKLAATNKANRAKQTVPHTGGSKPHMEHAREMERLTGRFPERHEVFRKTRTKKRRTSDPHEEVINPVAAEQYDQMLAIHSQASQPGSGVVLGGRKDALAAILGLDRHGRVRCLGSTVKTKQFWGEQSSSRASELKDENEKLKQRVAELEAQVAILISRTSLPPSANDEGLEVSFIIHFYFDIFNG